MAARKDKVYPCDCLAHKQDLRYGSGMRRFVYVKHLNRYVCSKCAAHIPTPRDIVELKQKIALYIAFKDSE